MKNIHVRDVPDDVHQTLIARAGAQGMSLSRYVVHLLEEHCDLPTIDEWLDELADLEPVDPGGTGAAAVRAARDEDDQRLARGRRR